MHVTSPSLRGHLPTLDGWRGIAILAVMGSHIRWPLPELLQLGRYGAMGVHLFFALSGFLITLRLMEEHRLLGSINWKNFYIRRVFRILPPAFLYLAVIAVLALGMRLIPASAAQLAASAFFFRNYLTSPSPEPWYTGHFWSLAVEEHFYLLWPLILVLSGRKAALIAPLLAVGVGFWRSLDQHYNWIASLNPLLKDSVSRTDYRLDILFWGCALALLWTRPGFRAWLSHWAGTRLVGALLALTAACLYWQPPAYLGILAVLMALLPAATLASPRAWISLLLESRPLTFVGRISYSLYLWQQLFLPVFGVEPTLGWLQTWPLNLLPVFGLATLSYYLVERPCIALGRRLQTAGAPAHVQTRSPLPGTLSRVARIQ